VSVSIKLYTKKEYYKTESEIRVTRSTS